MLEAFIVPPQRRGELTVFPVVEEDGRELPYRLMENALTSGDLTIDAGDSAEETRLVAHNRGSSAVLILNGERLIGGGRACMPSHSILLPPRADTTFPVALLDTGCGQERTASGGREGGSGKLGANRPDRRVFTLSRHPEADLGEWSGSFPLQNRQVGILVFHGPRFLGMDAVGSHSLYASVHERLLAGYVLAAQSVGEPPPGHPPPGEAEAVAFATALEEARRIPTRTVGLGTYSVFRGLVRGGELLHDDHLVHLSVFPLEPGRE